MINTLKRHYLALVLALLLGILMVLPFFYFKVKLGSGFKRVWPAVIDDESFYLARIKDVMDGHPLLSNAYLTEHKDGLPQQLFLAENILAWPLKLLGININIGHLIYNFLLPAIAFILTYVILYLILRSRFWSAVGSSFIFFGLFLLSFIRPVSPQFNFIFWLTQFIFLYLLVENPNSRRLVFINLFNFGLLFYIYPYYWTFYFIFFGLLAAFYFWKERAFSYRVLTIAGGGLVLAIPYFYLNYLALQLPYYAETMTRLGMIYTRFPSGIRVVFWSSLGLAAFGLLLWRKIISWDGKSIFFISGLLASVIGVNQHLITGQNLEFSSHYSMGAIFFSVFALAYLINCLSPNNPNYNPNIPNGDKFGLFGYIRIFGLLIIALMIIYGIYGYSKRVLVIRENHVYSQNYALVFEWLNKNTQKDSVVYANRDISGLVPIYTANNVFYVREANLFFAPDNEILDRFILNNFFEDFNQNFILKNVRAIYGVRYIDAYGHAVQGNKLRRILGLKLEPEIYLPEEALARVTDRARTLQKGDFEKEIKRYRLDYLIWDKNKNPGWRIDSRFFEHIFDANNIFVYKVK